MINWIEASIEETLWDSDCKPVDPEGTTSIAIYIIMLLDSDTAVQDLCLQLKSNNENV